MKILFSYSFCAIFAISQGVSTKMDFPGDDSYFTGANSNTNKTDEDVEVKVVVSTKLNNNNRRGITSNRNDGTLTYNVGSTDQNKEDNEEVPIIKGYKSVETTEIRTPDSRYKTKIYPDAIFVNRNIRDEGDVYPNVAVYPMNWKPANFYNNINYHVDQERDPYGMSRRRTQSPVKFHRKVTDEGAREFYCKKCAELSRGNFRGCGAQGVQQRSANSWIPMVPLETTTTKIKIDGKLAKLK